MSLKKSFDISGRTALVTGSSDGIGKAIALTLAEFGAFIFVHGKDNEQECLQVVDEIKTQKGNADFCMGDLADTKAVARIMSKVHHADILVLNASIQIRSDFSKLTQAEFDEQMHTNVWSSIQLINRYQPEMKTKQWGRILFIGSVQEAKPHPQMVVYAASKAANANMTINLAQQLASDKITVNNLAPGVIQTGRNQEALADAAYAEMVRKKIPSCFFGEPMDCAGLALLLCSDAGRYITGQTIYCDGGMSL
jgi:glucose 1-dehydrogenase